MTTLVRRLVIPVALLLQTLLTLLYISDNRRQRQMLDEDLVTMRTLRQQAETATKALRQCVILLDSRPAD